MSTYGYPRFDLSQDGWMQDYRKGKNYLVIGENESDRFSMLPTKEEIQRKLEKLVGDKKTENISESSTSVPKEKVAGEYFKIRVEITVTTVVYKKVDVGDLMRQLIPPFADSRMVDSFNVQTSRFAGETVTHSIVRETKHPLSSALRGKEAVERLMGLYLIEAEKRAIRKAKAEGHLKQENTYTVSSCFIL